MKHSVHFGSDVTFKSNLIPERGSDKKIGDVLWWLFYYGFRLKINSLVMLEQKSENSTCKSCLFKIALSLLINLCPFRMARRYLLRLVKNKRHSIHK